LIERMEELSRAIQILVNIADIQEKQRLEIINFHQPWTQGASYGTNEFLKYTIPGENKARLYRTTRNINPANTPPNITTNPQQYAEIK